MRVENTRTIGSCLSLISSIVSLPLSTSITAREIALLGKIEHISYANLRIKKQKNFEKAIMPQNGNYSSHHIEIIKLGHIKE